MTDRQKNVLKVALLSLLALASSAVLVMTQCVNEALVPGGGSSASPSPVLSVSPSMTPSPSSAPAPTPSVIPAPSPTVIPVPSSTVIPVPSGSPSNTTPSVTPSVTSSPVVSPSPSPSSLPTTVQILSTFERPEFAQESQWKSAVTRTLLDGQVTSIVLRTANPCALVTVPGIMKMVPVSLPKASASNYQAGVYYDALQPLDGSNCATAKYLQLDVSSTVSVGDASITILKKLSKAPAVPTVQLDVEFNNWVMVQGYCGGVGKYCNVESKGLQGSQVLKDHRISVYKQYPGAAFSWSTYVLPFNFGDLFAGAGPAPGDMKSAGSQTRPFVAYVRDEPKYDAYNALLSDLQSWKTQYPNVKRKVTMPIRPRDLNPTSPTFGKIIDLRQDIKDLIDVYQPVAEEFCVETWPGSKDVYPCVQDYAGKELGLYISNMSHGSEGGPATGAPDAVIDRSAVEMFGFFLMGIKYNAKLLYYNSIEGWEKGIAKDVWVDPYQFGGNGDGLLMYPDRVKQVALPSIRLKLIREASQWADVIALGGKKAEASALMTNPLSWDRTLAKFEQLRDTAMAGIQ